MSKKKTATLLLLCAVALVCSVSATSQEFPWEGKGELKPVSLPSEAGPVDLDFTFDLTKYFFENHPDRKELTFTAEAYNGLVYNGPASWTVSVADCQPYKTTLSVIIPADDTCWLDISISASCVNAMIWLYADSEGVKFAYGQPSIAGWHPANEKQLGTGDKMAQHLTEQQLNAVVQARFNMNQAYDRDRTRVFEFFGDELHAIEGDSVFIVESTARRIHKLMNWGVIFQILPPSKPVDSSSSSVPKPDSSKKPPKPKSTGKGDGSVYLIGVDGQAQAGYLPIDDTLTIYLGINNNTGNRLVGITNGFKVYSPDGATWSGTVGDTLGTVNWGSAFNLIHAINYFGCTGSGAY